LRNRQPGRQYLFFQGGDVLLIDERMVRGRDWVLPDQRFFRHQLAEVTRTRAHVTVRELEPGARKRIGELLRIRHETT
jgi:hypothetical protein